jgi:hypothetical protein
LSRLWVNALNKDKHVEVILLCGGCRSLWEYYVLCQNCNIAYDFRLIRHSVESRNTVSELLHSNNNITSDSKNFVLLTTGRGGGDKILLLTKPKSTDNRIQMTWASHSCNSQCRSATDLFWQCQNWLNMITEKSVNAYLDNRTGKAHSERNSTYWYERNAEPL